jgi:hypothetical protein
MEARVSFIRPKLAKGHSSLTIMLNIIEPLVSETLN